jgi:hypothetical protein
MKWFGFIGADGVYVVMICYRIHGYHVFLEDWT